eukprot:m.79962 g.79962  ORF g.79962 m.79962 type:complete len:244 (+) comp36156_c0_seq1:49-780(+)
MALLTVSVVLCLFALVSARSSGAPAGACISMTPSHSTAAAQASPSPYKVNITAVGVGYSPGASYYVTIDKVNPASPDFKGFLCQVRKADESSTDALGSFTSFDTAKAKALACTSPTGAVTHRNADTVAMIMAKWDAPNTDEGDLRVYCTVVQSFNTFWVKIPSESFSFLPTPTLPAPTPTEDDIIVIDATEEGPTLIEIDPTEEGPTPLPTSVDQFKEYFNKWICVFEEWKKEYEMWKEENCQ